MFLFRTCFSITTMVNALKIALQRRSGDILPGDIVLQRPLSLFTITGTQKELQKGSPNVSVKIVDKRRQNLYFPGGLFSGPVFSPYYGERIKIALHRRSGDISPGDIVLEHLLIPSTIRGTQKEFQKGPRNVSVKIVDKSLQNLHFSGGFFSGYVCQSLLW